MSAALRAFVVGYTGETGKALVKVLARDQRYSSVKLVGRREVNVDYGSDAGVEKKFSQHTIDFDKLDDYKSAFSESDVGFCVLGTSRAKSGVQQMRVIEHDYVLRIAQIALESGCQEFHVVTSSGANPDSRLFYFKLKGEIEQDLRASCVFPHYLAIYRPKFLLCNRTESRLGETALKIALKPFSYLAPTWFSVPVETVAQAMANAPFSLIPRLRARTNAATGDCTSQKVHVIENDFIFELAAEPTTDRQANVT